MLFRASKRAMLSIPFILKGVDTFRTGLGLLRAILATISYVPDHPEFSI
jgi:hypothetical protein